MNIIHKDELALRLEDAEEKTKKLIQTANSPVNFKQLEALQKRLEELEDRVKSLKPADDKTYNIGEEFKEIFKIESDLKLDESKPAPSASLLNQVFKTIGADRTARPVDKKAVAITFWKGRVIEPDRDYTLKQWITEPDGILPYMGKKIDNTFKPDEPEEKRICLGTGSGKSTFFLRCLAHRGKSTEELNKDKSLPRGATLIVPHKSLVGAVLDSHNDWLSDEQTALENIKELEAKEPTEENKKKIADAKRVLICPLCTKKHVGYETTHKESSSMINVFTWWEFLDAYVNEKVDKDKKPLIKEWVDFDEAHSQSPPAYQALLTGLMGDRVKGIEKYHKEIRPFKMLEMSATFPDLPTSKKLTGTISDYHVTDFTKIDISKHPDIFQRKVIAFCDTPNDKNKIDLKLLENQTKILVLNDALKPYATDIVKSKEPPLFVIASNDFSVGFSFGDVDVISTGEVMLNIVVEEGNQLVERQELVPCNIADLLQQRGRGARNSDMTAVWMSKVNEAKSYPKDILDKDYAAKSILKEFSKKDSKSRRPSIDLIDKNIIKKIVDFYDKDKEIKPLNPTKGNQYLNLVLIRDLKSKMNSKLWMVSQEEKDKVEKRRKFYLARAAQARKKGDEEAAQRWTAMADPKQLRARNPGEYIFENPLLEYFDEDQLPSIILEATKEKISRYNTDDLEDDYVFTDKEIATIVGWLLQCRDKNKYQVVTKKNKKRKIEEIRIQFEEYNKYSKIRRIRFN